MSDITSSTPSKPSILACNLVESISSLKNRFGELAQGLGQKSSAAHKERKQKKPTGIEAVRYALNAKMVGELSAHITALEYLLTVLGEWEDFIFKKKIVGEEADAEEALHILNKWYNEIGQDVYENEVKKSRLEYGIERIKQCMGNDGGFRIQINLDHDKALVTQLASIIEEKEKVFDLMVARLPPEACRLYFNKGLKAFSREKAIDFLKHYLDRDRDESADYWRDFQEESRRELIAARERALASLEVEMTAREKRITAQVAAALALDNTLTVHQETLLARKIVKDEDGEKLSRQFSDAKTAEVDQLLQFADARMEEADAKLNASIQKEEEQETEKRVDLRERAFGITSPTRRISQTGITSVGNKNVATTALRD